MTAASADGPSRTESGGPDRRILVLACGETERGDDGAALVAAETLRARMERGAQEARLAQGAPVRAQGAHRGQMPADLHASGSAGGPGAPSLPWEVEVRLVGQLEPDDLTGLAPGNRVVVIDAVRGIEPGRIVLRPLADLATGGPAPRSSHMLPLRDVLGIVTALEGSLPEGVFVGLGGTSFELGGQMSAAVRDAIPRYVAAIEQEVSRLAADG